MGTKATNRPRALFSLLEVVVVLCLCGGALAQTPPGGTLAGRVLDTEKEPVAEATVLVVGTGIRAVTGADGRFEIGRLPAGRQRLRVERLGFETLERRVDVGTAAGRSITLTLTMRPIAVEQVTVIGSRAERLELERRLRAIPGAVEHVGREAIERTRQANLKDVLRFSPGVWVQPKFGAADKSQLSIRGSGLRSSFELQGVNILVNGMPYRNADGFTDLASLELLTVDNIQVYKGGNALRYGGSTLGGAINFQTKTGRTAAPLELFAEGGGYGFFKGQLSAGATRGNFDYYVSYARSDVDGFRQLAHNERDRVNAHLGWLISPSVDLRTFYLFASVREDRPGALTRDELETNPRQANPSRVADPWGRDYTLHHVGVQLRSQLGAPRRLEISPYVQIRDELIPTFRVLDRASRDYGVEVRYEDTGSLGGRGNRLTLGFQGAYGETDNRHFQNIEGARGDLAKDQRDEAATIAFYAEDAFDVTGRLTAILGLRYDRSRRAVKDFFLGDGDQTDERWLDALMPRIGFIYEASRTDAQLFANASRIYEPPLLLELNSLTTPGFIALDPQTAWQFEIGSRGRSGGLGWSLSAFDMELRNEILNINVRPFPNAPFTVPTHRNAERTRHYGLEAALDVGLLSLFVDRGNVAGGGNPAGLVARLAYTLGRYAFVGDSVFDGNEIPGAPRHVLQAELAYRGPIGLTVRPSLEWVPGSYFVNSENTVRNRGWTVLGLRGDWEFPALGALLFVEIRNLTYERHAPAVNADNAAGRFFLPADGRALYGGVRWRPGAPSSGRVRHSPPSGTSRD